MRRIIRIIRHTLFWLVLFILTTLLVEWKGWDWKVIAIIFLIIGLYIIFVIPTTKEVKNEQRD